MFGHLQCQVAPSLNKKCLQEQLRGSGAQTKGSCPPLTKEKLRRSGAQRVRFILSHPWNFDPRQNDKLPPVIIEPSYHAL